MNVYIIGDCQNIQIENQGGKYFSNAPADILSIGGGYTIVSEVDNNDGTWTGEFKLREEIEFPYTDKTIRVELTDAIYTTIALDEEKKTLLNEVNQRTNTGVVLWFTDFVNNLMTPEETESYFVGLGALIKRK